MATALNPSMQMVATSPYSRLVLRGKCQALFRRRRSLKSVRLPSLFLCYTLIISLDMNHGNDLWVFLSEYLALIYFLLKFLAVLMILLSFISVFTCRYICAFRKRMCSYVRTTGDLLLYASRVMNLTFTVLLQGFLVIFIVQNRPSNSSPYMVTLCELSG